MKRFTRKQIVIFTFLILFMFAVAFHPAYQRWLDNRELLRNQQYIAHQDERMGIMRVSDKLKIDEIVAEVQKTGSISDGDLNWTLAMLGKNNSSGQPQEIARASILAPLEALKSIPSSQKDRIYQAAVPMLGNNPAYNNELDKIRASAVMGTLRDKRAIPYLVPLLDAKEIDQNGQLNLHAQAALEAIGYKAN